MTAREAYAAPPAIASAKGRGFDFSLADWRDIFLAITDSLASDGTVSMSGHVRATFVGPLREGAERWRIWTPRGGFECAYDPDRACVMSMIRPREPDGVVSDRVGAMA